MKTQSLLVALVTLLIGFGGGFLVSQSRQPAPMVHDMATTMDGMTASLSGKTGDDFDHTFLDEMIVHHEGAVAMAEMVLAESKRAELRQLAQDIIAAQTREIGMMRTWKADWFASH